MAYPHLEQEMNKKITEILRDPEDPRVFLLTLLSNYMPHDEHEVVSYHRFLTLIAEHKDCFDNYSLPGHITGSALVTNPDHSAVLLTHHKVVGKWLQFGGHSDGDSNVMATGLREAIEESGISQFMFHPSVQGVFDIDVHLMTNGDNKLKGQSHDHYDIRVLLIADPEAEIDRSVRESHDVKWISLDEVAEYNLDDSIQRMVKKLKKLT